MVGLLISLRSLRITYIFWDVSFSHKFFLSHEDLLFHARRWTEVCKQRALPNDGGYLHSRVSRTLIQSNTNWRSVYVQVLTDLSYQSALLYIWILSHCKCAPCSQAPHQQVTWSWKLRSSISQPTSRCSSYHSSAVLGWFWVDSPQYFVALG
jgi:hypothetical protein